MSAKVTNCHLDKHTHARTHACTHAHTHACMHAKCKSWLSTSKLAILKDYKEQSPATTQVTPRKYRSDYFYFCGEYSVVLWLLCKVSPSCLLSFDCLHRLGCLAGLITHLQCLPFPPGCLHFFTIHHPLFSDNCSSLVFCTYSANLNHIPTSLVFIGVFTPV